MRHIRQHRPQEHHRGDLVRLEHLENLAGESLPAARRLGAQKQIDVRVVVATDREFGVIGEAGRGRGIRPGGSVCPDAGPDQGAVAVIVGLVYAIWKDPDINEFLKGIATLVLGRFLGYLDNIYSFEFGTTRGSQNKDATISQLSAK